MNETLEAALSYAGRGWRVIPLHSVRADGTCTCGNAHAGSEKHIGKHPTMGGKFESYASSDPVVISQWFDNMGMFPWGNVGVVCGEVSNLWVLDIDGAHGMMELDKYEEEREGGPLPPTARARTGGGGLHFFWKWDGSQAIRTRIAAHFGVDVKANGYVVAPPSRHASGANYTWELECQPIVAPDDLVRWVKPPPRVKEDGTVEGEWPTFAEARRDGLEEGRRDDGIFHYALQLKRMGLGKREVHSQIQELAAACSPPFPAQEAEAKVEAAWKFDEEKKREGVNAAQESWARGLGQTGSSGNGGGTGEAGPGLWPGFGGTTDIDNAQRLMTQWEDAFPLKDGGWVKWDGTRWMRSDRPSLIAGFALREIITQEIGLVDMDTAQLLAKHRHRCGSLNVVNAALKYWESHATMTVKDLNPDPLLLGCTNGVLDLHFMPPQFRPYDRTDLITRCTNAAWEGIDAPCPTFRETLHYGIADLTDTHQRDVAHDFQAFLGVALTGLSIKNFLVLHGPGNTGKSTLIEAFAWALGDYAGVAPRGLLTKKVGARDEHSTIFTEVEGVRFTYGSEPAAGEELNVDLIKDITGGAELKARKMQQNFYTFHVEAKPLIDTNHPLQLRDVSPALEERMISLSMTTPIPPEARKSRDSIASKLRDEAPGILAWAARGLQRVLAANDGEMPGDLTGVLGETTLQERREAIESQDVVGEFINDYIEEVDDNDVILTKEQVREFYETLHMWGKVPWKWQTFSPKFTDALLSDRIHLNRPHPVLRERIGRKQVPLWRGIRLAPEHQESSDEDQHGRAVHQP